MDPDKIKKRIWKNMYIESIQVNNYKSFYNPDIIKFTKGVNLIVGGNNTGKSALLELLSTKAECIRHKSIVTKPPSNSYFKTANLL